MSELLNYVTGTDPTVLSGGVDPILSDASLPTQILVCLGPQWRSVELTLRYLLRLSSLDLGRSPMAYIPVAVGETRRRQRAGQLARTVHVVAAQTPELCDGFVVPLLLSMSTASANSARRVDIFVVVVCDLSEFASFPAHIERWMACMGGLQSSVGQGERVNFLAVFSCIGIDDFVAEVAPSSLLADYLQFWLRTQALPCPLRPALAITPALVSCDETPMRVLFDHWVKGTGEVISPEASTSESVYIPPNWDSSEKIDDWADSELRSLSDQGIEEVFPNVVFSDPKTEAEAVAASDSDNIIERVTASEAGGALSLFQDCFAQVFKNQRKADSDSISGAVSVPDERETTADTDLSSASTAETFFQRLLNAPGPHVRRAEETSPS